MQTTFMFALKAAVTPFGESSKTTVFPGTEFSFLQAAKKMSGSGFERSVSSPPCY